MANGGLRVEVRGTVQGVGYRPWVYQLALQHALGGRVWNHTRGVSIEVFGAGDALTTFVTTLRADGPPAARVQAVICSDLAPENTTRFVIDESGEDDGERRVSIPADLATCDACVGELFDRGNRRYRHPFINCTNCGPRYSIVKGSPYDRARTSMAGFPMCARCREEYDSPRDRRFHAQPNACPACGPRIVALSPRGDELATPDPIAFAARALRAGMIVALKGLGGFHLACDATSPRAIKRLRERKHRATKPFAVMVSGLAEAERLAEWSEVERALLQSVERPIVLARSRGVIGDLPLIGLFLPYTPLHHLLLHDAGAPLVMTSGNATGEPMVTTNDEALAQLGTIADILLVHDRDIVTRVDDSVVRVIGGAPVVLRRARGFVPRSLETTRTFDEPVLACGAHLKNTFCLAGGNRAWLGPHIGDLESVATLHAYEQAIEQMKELAGVTPTTVAYDLHPDYFSTRYALAQEGVRRVAVQHHHAHVAGVMAEHGLEGPVLGVAYDGTGFGTDETLWGGEVLLARYEDFTRVATFRPIALAGGEQAIRQPWRAALALLDDAFAGEPPLDAFPLFRERDPADVATVRRMIERNFNTTPARGVGRLFDAIGSLVLNRPVAHEEGDVAFAFNMVADPDEEGRYPVVIREGASPWEIDPRPLVRGVVDDLLSGCSAATISARFHNTLAFTTVEVVRAALATHGPLPVVLTGGCFQNARLAESILDALRPGVRVFMNRDVPPGDGGIALGQAFVANARLRARSTESIAAEEELVCV